MVTEEEIRKVLRTVYDPELGINIVDLGLVYEIICNEEEGEVDVVMTLTTPGCPLHDSLKTGVVNAISELENVEHVNVNLVWFPQWTPEMMSKEAKQQLWGSC